MIEQKGFQYMQPLSEGHWPDIASDLEVFT